MEQNKSSDNSFSAPMYSVIIPVFNSSDTLIQLNKRIQLVFQENIKENYEIIFIDDGSDNDQTWETLEKIQSQSPHVKIYQLSRNFGQHAATLCGIEQAEGDYIITMDDDLQHLPEDIPRLLSQKNHDVVMANFLFKQHSLFRRFSSKIKAWFAKIIIGIPSSIQPSPFRLMRSTIAKGMLSIQSANPYIPAMIFYLTKDVINIDCMHDKRKQGKSGYNLIRLVTIFSNLLINNSSLLLRFIGTIGIGISISSFILGLYFIIKKIVLKLGVPGWTSLIVAILFLGGLILFSLGVIGEYLIRIIRTAEQKPAFFIKQKKP